MKNQIKNGVEEALNTATQRVIDFLRHKESRESFGNENQLGVLAQSLGVTFAALERLKEIPDEESRKILEDQLSLEVKLLGYQTLNEVIAAYRKSLEHYQPSIDGQLVQDIFSKENYVRR
jgi:hypothetical protein